MRIANAVIVPSPLAGEGVNRFSTSRDWVRGHFVKGDFVKEPLTRSESAERSEPPSPTRGERLSWLSSGSPFPSVSDDGVEHGQELPGDGNQGDHLRLPGRDEAIEERSKDGIEAFRHHCAHEQCGSHRRAPAADEAL